MLIARILAVGILPILGCGTFFDHTVLFGEAPVSSATNVPKPYGGVLNEAGSIVGAIGNALKPRIEQMRLQGDVESRCL